MTEHVGAGGNLQKEQIPLFPFIYASTDTIDDDLRNVKWQGEGVGERENNNLLQHMTPNKGWVLECTWSCSRDLWMEFPRRWVEILIDQEQASSTSEKCTACYDLPPVGNHVVVTQIPDLLSVYHPSSFSHHILHK